MQFGIQFASYPADVDSVEVCQQISQRAQVAYKSNFDALFVSQHYLTGPDTAALQSLPLLGYLASSHPDNASIELEACLVPLPAVCGQHPQ